MAFWLGSFPPGEIGVGGGRTAHGKTSFLIH